MYTLNMITGTIKIRRNTSGRKMGEMREINREKFVLFLKEKKEEEKDPIRNQDYEILISAIMGIESLILEKKSIKVIFNEETRWKGQAEACITENNRLFRNISNFFDKSTKVKVMSTLF